MNKIIRSLAVSILACLPLKAVAVDVLVSSLTDSPDPATRGGPITYTITVENQQADVANDVTLAFPLPATTEFVSVDHAGCGHDGGTPGTVNCAFGNLLGTAAVPPGPVETVNVVINSTAATGATFQVIATAATSSTDTNGSNDSLDQNTTIDDGADLLPSFVSALPDPVTAGGFVTYILQVANNGPNDAVNPQVVIALSVDMTYAAGSASGTGWTCGYDAGSHRITCSRDSLAASATAPDITFQGQVTGALSGTLTTTATTSSDTGDPIPDNDVDTIDVTVNAGTDVSVGISASPSPVISGAAVDLILTPRNLGPFAAANVEVTTTIPVDFTIGTPSGSGWTCNVVAQTVTCNRAGYAVGGADDITIPLTAPVVGAITPYNNIPVDIATTTDEAPDRLANNHAETSITVLPDGADLSVTKTKAPQPVAQGSPITNTIVVHNNGPREVPANDLTLQEVLPSGETYAGFSGSGWNCIDNSPDIDCSYAPAIAAGTGASDLIITTTATGTGILTNTVTITSSDDYDSSNDGDNDSATSTAAIADLVVNKSALAGVDGDSNTLANNEQTIVYTVTIRNDGPDPADGITLTDPIAGYVDSNTGVAVTAKPANYSCSTGATVTCTQDSGTLAVGNTDSFTIEVTRPLFDSNNLSNTASAFSSTVGDNDRGNNSASATVDVDPVADIEVQSKTVTPNPVLAGVATTYVIAVRNNGPSTAQNVVLTDTFTVGTTAGFTFISASPSVGSCSGLTAGQSYTSTDPTPVLTCSLNDMVRGDAQSITLQLRPNWMASPPNPRELLNEAVAVTDTWESDDSNGDGNGEDETNSNNRKSQTLVVEQADVDLLINNSDTPDPVAWDPGSGGDNANNDVVYHVSFTNRGPSYATGVQYVYTMTPKAGKTVRFDCDEAAAADACGTSTDTCAITNGSNPVTGPATLELTCSASSVAGKTHEMTAGSTGNRYLHFRILSLPDSTGDTHNTNAVISANEPESILGNNAEAETTSVRGRVDLEVSKTPASATVQLQQPFNWTITVINNGPVRSDITDLTDTLPAGMAFHGAAPSWSNATDASSGSCTAAGSDLTCNLGLVSVGASAVVTVPVVIDGFNGASMDNCATAVTNGVDVIPSNNTDICGTVNVLNSYFPSDYGDAPDTSGGTGPGDYATTLANGGPRHLQPGGTWLGACVDSDGAGNHQNVQADADDTAAGTLQAGSCNDSDDEDGVLLPPALVADSEAQIEIIVSGADCALDGWIDYNADGDFDDANERLFTALSLSAGNHPQTVTVPAGIALGVSYARFRCSTAGGLTPVEEATGGEIEDYRVSLQPDGEANSTPTDYGDAPDPGTGTGTGNYRTLPGDNGASHVLGVTNAPYLGNCVDSDPDTQHNKTADADDLGAPGGTTPPVTVGSCTGGGDEDGVTFSTLTQGVAGDIGVTAAAGTNDCVLNAWIDYNADGNFQDGGEQIAADLTVVSGTTVNLNPTIPATATAGPTFARFRCASAGGLSPIGAAPDGEVEDYRVEIRPDLGSNPVDFGDAPDTTPAQSGGDYDTTNANNGPSHVLGSNTPYLGSCVDSDDGAQQDSGASADDDAAAGGAVSVTRGSCAAAGDEDGLRLPGPLYIGTGADLEITVGPAGDCYLNAWIDFDHDGLFNGAAEQVITDRLQPPGTVAHQVSIPDRAAAGITYARLRCSSLPGLAATGPAPDGEVEDHEITLVVMSLPVVGAWGLALLVLGIATLAFRQYRSPGYPKAARQATTR